MQTVRMLSWCWSMMHAAGWSAGYPVACLPGSGLLGLIFELLVGSNPASTLES